MIHTAGKKVLQLKLSLVFGIKPEERHFDDSVQRVYFCIPANARSARKGEGNTQASSFSIESI